MTEYFNLEGEWIQIRIECPLQSPFGFKFLLHTNMNLEGGSSSKINKEDSILHISGHFWTWEALGGK